MIDHGEMMIFDDESEHPVETFIFTIHAILISLPFILSCSLGETSLMSRALVNHRFDARPAEPRPIIEPQTRPTTKFDSEEMSFIKVDVFSKKMDRYFGTEHGRDLSTEDVGDYIFDSLDYTCRCFHTLRKP
jgi:hypothetical protein